MFKAEKHVFNGCKVSHFPSTEARLMWNRIYSGISSI